MASSRRAPSANRLKSSAPSGVRSMCSCPATYVSRLAISAGRMRLKAYRWQRERMVAGTLCSSVVARIAHREGYPEIGLYWEKAAYEEAEHAAKFAELLGSDLESNMTASTEKNLAWRVDCEYGATAGKFELATCAKKNNLDAIHDTVHEMARDEARHGKALEGMLKRYFNK